MNSLRLAQFDEQSDERLRNAIARSRHLLSAGDDADFPIVPLAVSPDDVAGQCAIERPASLRLPFQPEKT